MFPTSWRAMGSCLQGTSLSWPSSRAGSISSSPSHSISAPAAPTRCPCEVMKALHVPACPGLLPFQFAAPAWLSKGYRINLSVKKQRLLLDSKGTLHVLSCDTYLRFPPCSRVRHSPWASAELLPPHHPSIRQAQCPGPLKHKDRMLRLQQGSE